MSKRAAVIDSGPIEAKAIRPRSQKEFATRNCIHCAGELQGDDGDVRCARCGRDSSLSVCPHGAPRPAWRITRWYENPTPHGKRRRDVVAVTVGDHTVYLGRFRDNLALRAEDGARLPLSRVHAIEPGSEIIERMVHVGSCYRCNVAFFLPDCEIKAPGPPRILRVPVEAATRQYMRPIPEPARMAACYLALGTRPQEDDL